MAGEYGLLDSGKRLLSVSIGVLATRLELFGNEWEEERLRWVQMLLFALFATVSLCIGMLLLVFFLVVLFWDEHRLATLAALSLVFFVGGGFLVVLLLNKLKNGSKLFSASLAELVKDREAMEERHE